MSGSFPVFSDFTLSSRHTKKIYFKEYGVKKQESASELKFFYKKS